MVLHQLDWKGSLDHSGSGSVEWSYISWIGKVPLTTQVAEVKREFRSRSKIMVPPALFLEHLSQRKPSRKEVPRLSHSLMSLLFFLPISQKTLQGIEVFDSKQMPSFLIGLSKH